MADVVTEDANNADLTINRLNILKLIEASQKNST